MKQRSLAVLLSSVFFVTGCGGGDGGAASEVDELPAEVVAEDAVDVPAASETVEEPVDDSANDEVLTQLNAALEQLGFERVESTIDCLAERFAGREEELLATEDLTLAAGIACDETLMAEIVDLWSVPAGAEPCVLEVYSSWLGDASLEELAATAGNDDPPAAFTDRMMGECELTSAEMAEIFP